MLRSTKPMNGVRTGSMQAVPCGPFFRLAVVSILGCVAFALAPLRASEKTIVTVSASTRELPRKSEGDVVELDDGRLLLVSMEFGGDGSDFAKTRLVAHESADGGRTWIGHRVITDTAPGDVNVYAPNLIRAHDGGILLIFHRLHGHGERGLEYTLHAWKSSDQGRTFVPLTEFSVREDVALCNATVKRLASGRLLLPVSGPTPGKQENYEVAVLSSDDDGRTWKESANRLSLPLRGAMEPHVEQAADGRVVMVMRSQLGTVQLSESFDDGVNWSEPKSTDLTSPESCPELTRIPSTGDLLLIWNNSYDPKFRSHYGKRSPLTAAISKDHGRSWQHIRDIETDPQRAFSNPGCRFTRDGRAIINYWTCEYLPDWRMQDIIDLRVAVIDTDWFYETADEPAAWRVGVARVSITPTIPVWLAGYGAKREPDGTLHELWAKALAFEAADGGRAVLIASDFQGVPASMSGRVFERVEAEHGLDRSRVMFAYSHNHCSPRLGDDLLDYYPVDPAQEALVDRYTAECVEKCVNLVGDALAALAPATIRVGIGRAGFAVNRRDNVEAEVPRLLETGAIRGATDHTVPVMTVTRPDGKLDAVLFGYACHPTVLSFNTYCGDYPGFAQVALEKSHPGTTALFVNTCGGDQNPLPRKRLEICERYGLMLAAGVEEVLRQPMRPVHCRLRAAFEMVQLDFERVAAEADLREAAQDKNQVKARWARRMLAKLAAGETFPSSYPYPLHAWRLGDDTIMIGMGGETVVDYALRFKRQWGPGTWVLGYTDDMVAYIPSRRVWDEGGYEGGARIYEYGRPAYRWAGNVEDVIAAAVERLVAEMQ